MKPTTESNELSADEPRNWPTAERRERFQAWKAKMQVADAKISTWKTHWYVVDEDRPLNGFDELPPARPGDTRTPLLWVKFRDWSLKQVVVSRGRYDYDGGLWIARLTSKEDGDELGKVAPIEWAPIVDGERPWEGPTILKHDCDQW